MLRLSVFLFLLNVTLFSQNSVLVSTENEPSTFIQRDTKLFPMSDSMNIAVWLDYRDGISCYYAQYVNENNNLIGSNFKVAGNYIFSPINQNKFLNIYRSSSSSEFNSTITFGLGIYDEKNDLIEKKPLRFIDLGWCGTGYMGIYTDVILRDDYFILIGSFNGMLERNFFNYEGEKITDFGDGDDNVRSINATLSSAAKNSNNAYANLYVGGGYYDNYKVTCDIYDSLNNLVDTLTLQDFEGEQELWSILYDETKLTRVIPDPNDNFILTWVNPYEGKIYYNKVSPKGELFFEKPQEAGLNDFLPDEGSIANYSFTNFKDTIITCVLSFEYYNQSNEREYIHSIFKLNENFDLISSETKNNKIFLNINNVPVFDVNENLLIGSTINDDAYISIFNEFEKVDEIKLNDDLYGSNQYSTKLFHLEEDKNLVVWQDELGYKGREIDANNNLIGEQIDLPNSSIIYTSNNYKFSFYTKGGYNEPKSVGFRVYDENWSIKKWVLIDTVQSGYIYSKLKKINEFDIISASSHNKILQLNKYNYQGDLIRHEFIEYDTTLTGIDIFPQTDSTFLVTSNNMAVIYNDKLERISDYTIKLPYNTKFIIDTNKFVSFLNEYNYSGYGYNAYILINTFQGDTVYYNDKIINWGLPENIIKINNNEFLLISKYKEQYYGRVFSVIGKNWRSKFLVETSTQNKTEDLAVSISEKKVRFAWAEARVSGEGYSIYSSIYDKSLVTAVEQNSDDSDILYKFELSQNYPNPFNPSTTIEFNLPATEKVRLEVYNIIGEKLFTAVDSKLVSGFHTINIDMSNYSSGIYFYRLVTGGNLLTKKMILLK